MNKRGFTLVELLSVVAIIALLVVIALPNVMDTFNKSKQESFTTEVKQLYKVAEQTWMSENLFGSKERVYARCEGCTEEELDMSGRKSLDYLIKVNKAGKVVELYVTDGTYQIEMTGNIKIETIKDVKTVANLEEDEIIVIKDDQVTGTASSSKIKICFYVGQESCAHEPYNTFNKSYVEVEATDTINTLRNKGLIDQYNEYPFVPKNEAHQRKGYFWTPTDSDDDDQPLKDYTQGCYDGIMWAIC